MNQHALATALAVSISALLAGAAGAQQKDSDALKGPAVQDRVVPGAVGQFGSADGKEKGKFAQREMRPAVFMESLMKALGPDAPEDVRASEELRAKLRTMGAEYRKQVEAYMKANNVDAQAMRKAEARRAKKSSGEAAEGQKNDGGEMSEEMAAKMKAVRDGMPSASDFYTKVWDLLSEKQRAAVEARLEEFKHQQEVKEGKDYVERKLKKAEPVPGQQPELAKQKGKFAAPADKAGAARPEVAKLAPETRERFMRLLERLSPEEREQLLNRLEERFRERAGEGARERGQKREAPKPAPTSDTVNIPKPE